MNAPSQAEIRTPQLLSEVREGSIAKLRRRLSGDLDTIIRRAMHKEPGRRYVSVEQFAEDIRRHLDGLPVTARRDSLRYRAGKFVLRHKIGAAATALIVIAIAGGVGATIREARIAAANERRAEERFNDVRKLANSLMFEIHDAIRDLPGSTDARRLLVTRALEYLDNLGRQSKGDVSLQKEIAAAYDRVGDVLGYPYAANLGDSAGALNSYHKALAIREPLLNASPNDTILQRDVLGTYFRMAQVLDSVGNFPEALAALAKAQPLAEQQARENSDGIAADHYAGVYYFTATIKVRTAAMQEALENYRRAAAIRSAALDKDPNNFILRTHLAADYGGLARCYASSKDYSHATEMQSKATDILSNVANSNPGNATLMEYLGESINLLADYRLESGDQAAALNNYRQAHKVFADLLSADAKNLLAKTNFAFSDNGIAGTLLRMGRVNDALKTYRESVSVFEQMSPRSSGNRYLRTGLANAYDGLADAYNAMAKSEHSSAKLQRQYWTEAHTACRISSELWQDKNKRGELETGEEESAAQAAQCLSSTEAKLRSPNLK